MTLTELYHRATRIVDAANRGDFTREQAESRIREIFAENGMDAPSLPSVIDEEEDSSSFDDSSSSYEESEESCS